MSKIGIFFGGKDSGSTAKVARKIQELFGADVAAIHNVHSTTKHDVQSMIPDFRYRCMGHR